MWAYFYHVYKNDKQLCHKNDDCRLPYEYRTAHISYRREISHETRPNAFIPEDSIRKELDALGTRISNQLSDESPRKYIHT